NLLKIIALVFPFLLINNTLISVLNGLRKMKLYAFTQVFRRATVLIFTFVLVFLGFGVAGAVWALVIPAALTTILVLLISKDYLYFSLNNFVGTSKTLISFGSKVFAANIVGTINTRADMLFIGFFLLDKDVGIYAVAVMFVHFLLVIPKAVQRITYPAISELWAKKSYKAIENMINKCMKYSFVILAPLGILLAFFAKDIIQFIYFNRPDEFLPAIIPLQILIMAFVFRGAFTSVGPAFGSIGKPGYTLHIVSIITVINVCLNIILIPLYGINGAAVATSFSFILGTCVGIYLLKKLLKITISLDWFIKIILISCGIYLLMVFLDNLIYHYLIGFIGIILYFGLLILTKTIGKEDWHLFRKILNFKN
ncbi:MAG: flippase, partial [Thermoplasmata archaeon]|nr:flippase [Thermoplasmata archaeon]